MAVGLSKARVNFDSQLSALRSLRSLWLFFFAVDRALPVSLRNERIADSPRSRRSGTLVPAFATLRSAHTPASLLPGGVFRPTDPPPGLADDEPDGIPSTTQRGFFGGPPHCARSDTECHPSRLPR